MCAIAHSTRSSSVVIFGKGNDEMDRCGKRCGTVHRYARTRGNVVSGSGHFSWSKRHRRIISSTAPFTTPRLGLNSTTRPFPMCTATWYTLNPYAPCVTSKAPSGTASDISRDVMLPVANAFMAASASTKRSSLHRMWRSGRVNLHRWRMCGVDSCRPLVVTAEKKPLHRRAAASPEYVDRHLGVMLHVEPHPAELAVQRGVGVQTA